MQTRNKKELSYFNAALLYYLREYHPHIARDDKLIGIRSQAAEDLFYELVHEGKDHYTAHSLALEELYTGLEFSLYYLIYDIVREDKRIPANRRRTVSVGLLPLCNPLLDNYAETDLSEDWFSMELLEQEIKAIIKQYLKNNGI